MSGFFRIDISFLYMYSVIIITMRTFNMFRKISTLVFIFSLFSIFFFTAVFSTGVQAVILPIDTPTPICQPGDNCNPPIPHNTPTPTPACVVPPPCIYAKPACIPPVPPGGWCLIRWGTPTACAKKSIGDADCNNTVDSIDYLYYVAAVNGGRVPANISPDFNNDGEVGKKDRDIIIATLNGGSRTPTATGVPAGN